MLNELFSLNGKKAIVTGAGKRSGLSFGMAEALHGAGAEIALMDIAPSVTALAEELGGAKNGYYAVQADISDRNEMQAAFQKALDCLGGRVDILVNGAGINYRAPAIDMEPEQWDKVIHINLTSVFLLSQLAARNMMENGGGKIINIASMNAYCASYLIPSYAASKGGIVSLTKELSNEWAKSGICVNAIAPGYMATEFTEALLNSERGKSLFVRIPMERWGKPQDMAGAAIFLASKASDYVSGAILPVDGGFLGR